MSKKAKQRRELSDEERSAAERAKAFFKERQKPLHLGTQEEAAAKLGWTQGGLWQYLNARVPLNWEATCKLAKLLQVEPHDIFPELAEMMGSGVKDRRSDLPPDALEVAYLYRQLNPHAQRHIKAFLSMAVTLSRNGMDVNLEPDERYREYESKREDDKVERRQDLSTYLKTSDK